MKILRYVRWHPKNTLEEVKRHCERKNSDGYDDINMTIIHLCMTDYLVCRHLDGTYTQFKENPPWNQHYKDRLWITPKGRQLLEERFDRVWQWAIPTLISVAALIVSFFSVA